MRQQEAANSYKLNQLQPFPSSTESAKSRQAGDDLSLTIEDEVNETAANEVNIPNEPSTPLFIRDSPEGNKENAQDEKDETEE